VCVGFRAYAVSTPAGEHTPPGTPKQHARVAPGTRREPDGAHAGPCVVRRRAAVRGAHPGQRVCRARALLRTRHVRQRHLRMRARQVRRGAPWAPSMPFTCRAWWRACGVEGSMPVCHESGLQPSCRMAVVECCMQAFCVVHALVPCGCAAAPSLAGGAFAR